MSAPVTSTDIRGIALDDLRACAVVADSAGFRRASRDSGSKQSVLSRRVRGLEGELGASLFERTRDGVRLTYAGLRFLREVRAIFSGLESAVRAVRAAGAAAEGCIRIGTVASLSGGFLCQLIGDWRALRPPIGARPPQ
ncbi:MAG: LysR family transcriptional regulator [Phycisphaerales bacterium]|nr:LysR family transcriptional regulator [Hyphomonadaceae bacterium]